MDLKPADDRQPLLHGFSLQDVQSLVDDNPYLRGYLQGYLAEARLRTLVESLPGVESVAKIPDASSAKGDLEVVFRGCQLSIESKSLSTGVLRKDVLNEAWEASVLCKNTDKREVYVEGLGDIRSVNLRKGEFDILSICTYPVTGRWEFVFLPNRFLPEPEDKPGFIKSRFTINTATTVGLTSNLLGLLRETALLKSEFAC